MSASNVTAVNKQLLVAAYAEVAKGNQTPIREMYDDDITSTTIGTTAWSKTYTGKQAVLDMFGRLFNLLSGPHVVTAQRFIADGDIVVVESRGQTMTKTGKPYNNTYCMVYRLAEGRIKEVTEYCDTALIDTAL